MHQIQENRTINDGGDTFCKQKTPTHVEKNAIDFSECVATIDFWECVATIDFWEYVATIDFWECVATIDFWECA